VGVVEVSMADKEKIVFSIQVPKEMNEELDEETKRKSRSRNFVVNLALRLFLDKPEKERDKLYP
jgi:metal-responsive CopG/Arc/MetJ family transcriptional regulator